MHKRDKYILRITSKLHAGLNTLMKHQKTFKNICLHLSRDIRYPTMWYVRPAKVSNGAKIRNRYNQVPHLTQDTNGKVTNSQKTPQTRAKRSALSQQVTTKHI